MNRPVQEQLAEVLDGMDGSADPGREEDGPMTIEVPADRARTFTHTSFSRMRTEWPGEDFAKLEELKLLARQAVREHFASAFIAMDRLFLCVREPLTYEGQIILGPDSSPRWKTDEDGAIIEDWALLGDEQRRRFLWTITTHLFQWELAATDGWLPAMIAKAQWEENFARGFTLMPNRPNTATGKPTIDDRTQAGHINSTEERYFAIFQAYISKMMDALIRSLVRIQRLLENTYMD
jgi:hypothetical protein